MRISFCSPTWKIIQNYQLPCDQWLHMHALLGNTFITQPCNWIQPPVSEYILHWSMTIIGHQIYVLYFHFTTTHGRFNQLTDMFIKSRISENEIFAICSILSTIAFAFQLSYLNLRELQSLKHLLAIRSSHNSTKMENKRLTAGTIFS